MKTRTCFVLFLSIYAYLQATLASAANEPKEWTVLVFLNAYNNLDPYSFLNMREMERVGSTKDVNIVVQWASLANVTTKRVLVTKSTNPDAVTSPVIEDIGQVDMGDWRNLVAFVDWAQRNYPAKKYFLSIWNHGSGWHLQKLKRRGGLQASDISFDDNTGNYITTKQMGDAFRQIKQILGQKIDLYGSDACLMAMAEVAAEVQDSVDVFAGSQENEPAEGWPYDMFLDALVKKPTMDARQLGTTLSKAYLRSYTNGSHGNKPVTFSILDLRFYDKFATAMRAFSDELQRNTSAANRDSTIKTAAESQGFYYTDYRDLSHFVSLLGRNRNSPVRQEIRDNLLNAYQQMLVTNDVSRPYANAKGLSFWLPIDAEGHRYYKQRYEELKFEQDTAWGDALQVVFP